MTKFIDKFDITDNCEVRVKKCTVTENYMLEYNEYIYARAIHVDLTGDSGAGEAFVTLTWHKPFCVNAMKRSVTIQSIGHEAAQSLVNFLYNRGMTDQAAFIVGYYMLARGGGNVVMPEGKKEDG